METRWAFHRRENPTDDLPHFDMLPSRAPALGKAGAIEGAGTCQLHSRRSSASVLGFHRLDDVPGLEIPSRYFQFLRTGDASVIEGVLEHNRHDLISLAAVMSHALRLARGRTGRVRDDARSSWALGRLYERAGPRRARSRRMGWPAASDDRNRGRTRSRGWRCCSGARRDSTSGRGRWRGVLAPGHREPPRHTPLERRAAEALAIHHEHRARDLHAAPSYAETLRGDAGGRARRRRGSPARPSWIER